MYDQCRSLRLVVSIDWLAGSIAFEYNPIVNPPTIRAPNSRPSPEVHVRNLTFLLLPLITSASPVALAAQTPDAKGVEFFESKIRPVLVEHCYKCHSEEARKNRKLKGDLLLDTKAGLLAGG